MSFSDKGMSKEAKQKMKAKVKDLKNSLLATNGQNNLRVFLGKSLENRYAFCKLYPTAFNEELSGKGSPPEIASIIRVAVYEEEKNAKRKAAKSKMVRVLNAESSDKYSDKAPKRKSRKHVRFNLNPDISKTVQQPQQKQPKSMLKSKPFVASPVNKFPKSKALSNQHVFFSEAAVANPADPGNSKTVTPSKPEVGMPESSVLNSILRAFSSIASLLCLCLCCMCSENSDVEQNTTGYRA